MKLALLTLLLCSTMTFAQPVEGPFVVTENDSLIHHIHVTARNDSIADVFYQIGNTAYHSAFSLRVGQVYAGPDALLMSDQWGRTLVDAIKTDSGWSAGVYDTTADYNRTKIYIGSDSSTDVFTIDSVRSHLVWQLGGNTKNHIRLTHSNENTVIITWIDFWEVWVGFPEGGRGCVAKRISLSDGQILRQGEYGSAGTDIWAINVASDTPELATTDDYGICIDPALYGNGWYPCSEYGSFNCPCSPVAWLTMNGRILMLSKPTRSRNTRILEVDTANHQCIELLNTDQQQITAGTSNENHGFAWLSQPSSGLLLNRTDTTGMLVSPAGVVSWPDQNTRIVSSNITISDSGKIVIVWSTQSTDTSQPEQLWVASVGWNTPLSADEPFTPQPSSFNLSAFPNPFNSEVRIEYNLAKSENIELIAYNLLGQKVATLENKLQTAGNHEIHWSPDNLSSGVYLLSLKTQTQIKTQKILYLK